MLDAVYAACLGVADRLWRRRRRALLVGLPLVLVLTLAINRVVLHDFPNSSDEYLFLYQAATMAAGRLWNHPPPSPEAFTFTYMAQDGSRMYGTFPFGWPLVLTLALLLRIPVWLVNPLLGCLTVVLAGVLGHRLYSPAAGVWAALVVATMPFVLFNAASYFSHTFCGVVLLAAACIAARDDRRPPHALAVGALLAGAVLARYYTGVICGIPIALLLLRRNPGTSNSAYRRFVISMVSCVALGGVPGALVLAAYDTVINGNPWRLAMHASSYGNWFKPGFAMRGADILSSHVARDLLWTPPALVVLYAIYLWTTPRARRTPLDWMLAATALTLFFYYERGGNQYGARFHYEAFLFATVFVCGQLFRHASLAGAPRRDRWAFAALALSVLAVPAQLVTHAVTEERVIRERMDPFTLAGQARLHDAVVFMDGRVGTTRSMPARDLTRNGLTYDRPVLYALDAGAPLDCEVMTLYPGRSAYRYVWDVGQRQGMLTEMPCRNGVGP
jgi:hypothetical protein